MQCSVKQLIAEYVETHLSEKRKVHTMAVVAEALALAEAYGADREKAELAALAHDMFRGTEPQILNDYVRALGLPSVYLNNVNLSHGKIAAKILERDYGITDPELLHAVSYHTTGRAGMSLLEKVIYLADAIEPNRDYPGVEMLRKLAYEDLNRACLYSFQHTISFVNSQGHYLDPDTLAAEKDFAHKLKLQEKEGVFMTSREIALHTAEILDEKKAADLVVIDIAEKSSFADYFVIATGNSERQISALQEEVESRLAKKEIYPKSVEGKSSTGWILMDLGDVIVNLFTSEQRDRYNIEKIWGDCPFLSFEKEEE